MDCSKCKDSMYDYANGCLEIRNSIAVNKHLEACEGCRRELDEILRLKEVSRTFTSSPKLQLDLKNSIMASIDLDRYKAPRKKNRNEMLKWGISMVAAGLVMMVLNSVPVPYENIERVTEQNKIIQSVDSFGKDVTTISERLIQLNGITDRLEKHRNKGGI